MSSIEKILNDKNNPEAIDKAINEVYKDGLNAMQNSLNHLNEEQLLHEIHEMLQACDKKELKKILQLLIDMSFASCDTE